MHYGVSGAMSAALPYILLSLYTIYLNPAEFGQLSLVMSVVFITSTICSFGAGELNRREIADNPARGPLLFYRIIALSTMICCVLAFGLLTASYFGYGIFNLSSLAIAGGILIGYGRTIFTLSLIPVQMSGRSYVHAVISIALTVILTLLTIVFLVPLSFGWQSRILGELVALIFILSALLINLGFLFRAKDGGQIQATTDTSQFSYQQILRASLPIGLTLFVNSCYVVLDRFLLSYFFDFAQVGLYTFNLQVAAVFGLLLTIVKESFTPVIYEHLRQENKNAVSLIMAKIAISFVVVGAIMYVAFNFVVELGLLGSYGVSIAFTSWVIATAAVNNFSILYIVVLFYTRKARVMLYLQLASFAINCAASITLIDYFGPTAIAIGSFCASVMLLLSIVIYGQRSLSNHIKAQGS